MTRETYSVPKKINLYMNFSADESAEGLVTPPTTHLYAVMALQKGACCKKIKRGLLFSVPRQSNL